MKTSVFLSEDRHPTSRLGLLATAFVLAAAVSPVSHAADAYTNANANATKPVGNLIAGKAGFAKCASCHQVGPSARAGFGPQLNGIVGRPAAASKDYRYSAALQNSHIVWTEDKLRAFLKSPGDVVPGTKMRFWGISNEQDLSNLLAYLKTFN